MSGNLSMSYTDMATKSTNLKQMTNDLRDLIGRMTTEVNSLCDGWTAEASPVFRDDYATLASNVNNTSQVVDQLTETVDNYVRDMQDLDHSYASGKVSIG